MSLIILDLAMPVMTFTPRPKVLFSSGLDERKFIHRLEGFPFLQKPYTAKELAERVKKRASVA